MIKKYKFEQKISIKDICIDDYLDFPATLLSNVTDIDQNLFENFATNNNSKKHLPYDGRPSFGFSGNALDEVAPHFDGVSASIPEKVPEWLVFWASGEIEEGNGGEYKICDCTAIERDQALLEKLQGVRQQFVDYVASIEGDDGPDEFSFPIVTSFEGKLSLRVFLDPDDVSIRTVPGVNTRFIGENGDDLEHLRKPIHNLFKDTENYEQVRLKRDCILIVNNKLCFHGRNRLKSASQRLFYRVQILS